MPVTITFTFSSLDVVFQPAQLQWHSLDSCQHLSRSPSSGEGASHHPHSWLLHLPRGRHSPCCITLPVFAAVCSQHQAALFTCCSAPCLYKPREDSTSLRFKRCCSEVAGKGERELLGDCKEAPRQTSALSFLPPLLSCTTLAPLNIRLARKTRHVGAALQRRPLAERSGGGDSSSPPLSFNPRWVAGGADQLMGVSKNPRQRLQVLKCSWGVNLCCLSLGSAVDQIPLSLCHPLFPLPWVLMCFFGEDPHKQGRQSSGFFRHQSWGQRVEGRCPAAFCLSCFLAKTT